MGGGVSFCHTLDQPRAALTQVSNGNGDMRWALEACAKAVDAAVSQAEAATPGTSWPLVGLKHMRAVLFHMSG